MSKRMHQKAVNTFVSVNYVRLAANLVEFRKTRVWPQDCKFHDLASLCVPLAADGDEYNEAERLVVSFLLENAAKVLTDRGQKKSSQLESCLVRPSLTQAFEAAALKWPGVKLGYIGTDLKTFRHYFQEFGNPLQFIL
jgi:hypothetical protein